MKFLIWIFFELERPIIYSDYYVSICCTQEKAGPASAGSRGRHRGHEC